YDGNGQVISNDVIASNVTGSTWEWLIPSDLDLSDHYKIRISGSLPGSPDAYSDFEFSVVNTLGGIVKVIQPSDPGIKWLAGTNHLISWEDGLTESVNIQLYRYDGNGQVISNDVIASNVTGSTWEWLIPSDLDLSDHYKIRISGSLPGSPDGYSVNEFSIVNTLGGIVKVIQPSESGIKWLRGTNHLISWEDGLTESVNIQWYKYDDNGQVISNDVIAWNVTGSTWEWLIPSDLDLSDHYKIRISGSLPGSPDGYSVNEFSIVNTLGGAVTVLQPSVPGIKWLRGTNHLISWEDGLTESVNIQLYRYDGNGQVISNDVIAWNVTGSTWEWLIPSDLDLSDHYKIRISGSLPGSPDGYSEHEFSIVSTIGSVEVIQPNGGEEWYQGSSNLISWDDGLTESVNIQLVDYSSGSAVYDLIASNVTGSTWQWNIPTGQTPGDHYKIRISGSLPGSPDAYSDAYFKIKLLIDLGIYPNPCDPFVTLRFNNDNSDNYTLNLFDRFGTSVIQKSINTSDTKEITLPTYDLPNGIYFLNMTAGEKRISKKIVVQH
ncbi:MAG: T9SS type A sorting domain-containing protein, partial [Bacteroidales bacterium]|nr:T9SS type A sorting domain-containing protein [Bacteroidales bacterium]